MITALTVFLWVKIDVREIGMAMVLLVTLSVLLALSQDISLILFLHAASNIMRS